MAVRATNIVSVLVNEHEVRAIANLFGTSSDAKPTEGYANGSTFLEVDTGKIFLFNETTGAWVELS